MSREDSLTLHRSHLVTLTIRILQKSSAHITDIIRKDLLGLWIQGFVHELTLCEQQIQYMYSFRILHFCQLSWIVLSIST